MTSFPHLQINLLEDRFIQIREPATQADPHQFQCPLIQLEDLSEFLLGRHRAEYLQRPLMVGPGLAGWLRRSGGVGR